MEAERKKQILLGVLTVAVAGFVAWQFWPGPSARPVVASNQGGKPANASRSATPLASAPDVRLTALGAERPKPDVAGRNLFRFKPKVPPPPPPPPKPTPAQLAAQAAAQAAAAAAAANAPPPPPPPPPPITLKFIGVVESAEKVGKIAVLTDGRAVFYGRAGDIIEGRYRINRIGAESVEMGYVDGRGTTTIRLSGS